MCFSVFYYPFPPISRSHELVLAKERVEQLTKENRELKAETLQLKTLLRRHDVSLPRASSRRTPPTRQADTEPGYLRTTVASQTRSSIAPIQENSPNPKKYETVKIGWRGAARYDDGKLIELKRDYFGPEQRYMSSTVSSANRRCWAMLPYKHL
ncbi:uncharacterized protein F4822DRAFT_196050 [Hypoxylon trugodes]|uniref:uncharacterized protein n=1 Tax=Hypoxylon trugodes TaxID=326681 RepID=UPI00219ED35B|nr:uncharacterized protein F4822DRAFT_196050 [Hypoxylon trugodes]KAI1389297.1 hypothetical protein F4822DRAFT_196050 [Hypoxylon trugodes]